ncbi:MAG: hypothetical protein IJO68_07235 [Clostridia bacterium]|nr:hypothetical protein [Clostridia bacterium]
MGAQITVFGAQNIFDSLLPLAEILPESVYVPLAEFSVLVLRLFAVPMYGLPEPQNTTTAISVPFPVQPLGYCRLGLVTLPL